MNEIGLEEERKVRKRNRKILIGFIIIFIIGFASGYYVYTHPEMSLLGISTTTILPSKLQGNNLLSTQLSTSPTNKTIDGTQYNYHSSTSYFDIYFRNNTNTAKFIRIERDGYNFTTDVSTGSINWYGQVGKPTATDTLGGGVTSNTKDTQLNINGNKISYPNSYSATNLTYEITSNKVKETFALSLNDLPSIKNYTYLQYSIHFYFDKSLNICANGICYTPKGTQDNFNTTGKIDFKDQNNITRFSLGIPIINDDKNGITRGIYFVSGSNAQMALDMRIPTSYIQDAISRGAKYIYFDPTYEVIPISDAIHLDSSKNFIENIYNQTQALDNITKTIPVNDYIRVRFERELTSSNDIMVYANASNATLEVYEFNSTNKIATYPLINNKKSYDILLTNITSPSDTFDLKVSGSLIEFDYILDPTTLIYTCTDLQNMRNDLAGSYALANNIDCGSFGNFEPIGKPGTAGFTGTFDGANKSISNLYINWSIAGGGNIGLFGILPSGCTNIPNRIHDFVMYNETVWTIASVDRVGGVVGLDYCGGVQRVAVYGTITHLGGNTNTDGIGGVMGADLGGQIYGYSAYSNDLYFNGTIIGQRRMGGICGTYCTTNRSYSTGIINGSQDLSNGGVGGLGAGYEWGDSWTTAKVYGDPNYVFAMLVDSPIATNLFYYNWTTDDATKCQSSGETGCTAINAPSTVSYFYNISNAPMNTWDFNTVWSNKTNLLDYPHFKWELPTINYISPTPNDYNVSSSNSFIVNTSINFPPNSVGFTLYNQSLNTTGLVGYWNFDRNLSTAKDLSSNGKDGVITKAYWNQNGNLNGAMNFTGTANQDSSIVAPPLQVGYTRTISFWLKTTKNAYVIDMGAAESLFWVQVHNGQVITGNDNGYGGTVASNSNPQTGNWVFVTVVGNSTGYIGIYVNGTFDNSGVVDAGTRTPNEFRISGYQSANEAYKIDGLIDEVMVWNRVLSASEISNLYNRQVVNYTTNGNKQVTWNSLANGNYTYYADTVDTDNNYNNAPIRNILINATGAPPQTYPQIQFVSPTDTSGEIVERPNIILNVTGSDTNWGNMTLYVWNTTTTFSNFTTGTQIYWNKSSLSDGLYYFQANATNTQGNKNATEIRNITIDVADLGISYVAPTQVSGLTFNRNYIEVNITGILNLIDLLDNFTVYLYNQTGLVNSSFSRSSPFYNNFSILPEGIYYFNATRYSILNGNANLPTRTITLDRTNPLTQFVSPTNVSGTYTNNNNISINVTSTDINLKNITINVYNTSGLFNSSFSTASPFYIKYINAPDGIYFYNSTTYDSANNVNNTETRNLTIDTIKPNINFTSPTSNGITAGRDNIMINASGSDINWAYLNITIWNSTNSWKNSTTNTQLFWNQTGFSDGTYFFQANATDLAGNTNSTEIRNITLNTQVPIINILEPRENNIYSGTNTSLNVSLSGATIDKSWYSLSSDYGMIIGNTTFTPNIIVNIPYTSNYTFYVWANSTSGIVTEAIRNFRFVFVNGTIGQPGVNGTGYYINSTSWAGCSNGGYNYSGWFITSSGVYVLNSTWVICNGNNGSPGSPGSPGAPGINGTNGTNGINGVNGTNFIGIGCQMQRPLFDDLTIKFIHRPNYCIL